MQMFLINFVWLCLQSYVPLNIFVLRFVIQFTELCTLGDMWVVLCSSVHRVTCSWTYVLHCATQFTEFCALGHVCWVVQFSSQRYIFLDICVVLCNSIYWILCPWTRVLVCATQFTELHAHGYVCCLGYLIIFRFIFPWFKYILKNNWITIKLEYCMNDM